jgi:hypothetical protein
MVGQSHSFSHLRTVAFAPRVAMCLAVHACTSVNGGAVELSWKLRAASGSTDNFVVCTPNGQLVDSSGVPFPGEDGLVTAIRLYWQADRSGSTDFKCAASHGVTTFEVPAGIALLSVKPICASGAPPDLDGGVPVYVAPAPEERHVITGDTVSLGAVEIVMQVSNCSSSHPCVCQ